MILPFHSLIISFVLGDGVVDDNFAHIGDSFLELRDLCSLPLDFSLLLRIQNVKLRENVNGEETQLR
jgi:hypothetical protein